MPDDEHALEVAGVVRTYLRSGYTLLVGAGSLKPRADVLVQRAIDKGLVEGPRLVPSGEMITQRGAIGAGNLREVGDAGEMRRAVGEQVELGVRSVKLMASGDGIVPGHPSQVTYLDDAMVAAAVDEAAAGGAFVTAHARGPDSVRMCVRNGVRIVHHATYLDDESIAALTAARDEVWVCPGLHYLRMMVEGRAEPYGISRARVEAALYPEELEAQVDGIRKLHANGVRFVAGGDFGHQWTRHGTYAAELLAYVELAGLTPLDALLTATANAGRWWASGSAAWRPATWRTSSSSTATRPPTCRCCSTTTGSARWSRPACRCPRAGARSSAGPAPAPRDRRRSSEPGRRKAQTTSRTATSERPQRLMSPWTSAFGSAASSRGGWPRRRRPRPRPGVPSAPAASPRPPRGACRRRRSRGR